MNSDVIAGVELDPLGYKILLEILAKGEYRTVAEIPYTFHDRERGESNLRLEEYLKFVYHLLSLYSERRISESREYTGNTGANQGMSSTNGKKR